jgi:hypothetical protein
MKDEAKRARRRRDLARMKQRAREFYPRMEERSVKLANHLAYCSCHACRNPRHSHFSKGERLTMQERKAEEAHMEIVSNKQAESCDYYVCALAGASPFSDNEYAKCCNCGRTVMHRPNGPVTPEKICIECALALTEGNSVDVVTTDKMLKEAKDKMV